MPFQGDCWPSCAPTREKTQGIKMTLKSNPLNRIFQSLVLAFAFSTNVNAFTLCIRDYCNVTPTRYSPPLLEPSLQVPVDLRWFLELVPFQNADGWNYSFHIGGSDIASISVPYFDGWEASSVNVPDGWTYQVVPASVSLFANDVALWERQSGAPTSFISVGASFTSDFGPARSTVEIRDAVGDVFDGALFIPLTPSAISAGLTAVPIPASIWLFGIALIGLRGVVRTAGGSKKLGPYI